MLKNKVLVCQQVELSFKKKKPSSIFKFQEQEELMALDAKDDSSYYDTNSEEEDEEREKQSEIQYKYVDIDKLTKSDISGLQIRVFIEEDQMYKTYNVYCYYVSSKKFHFKCNGCQQKVYINKNVDLNLLHDLSYFYEMQDDIDVHPCTCSPFKALHHEYVGKKNNIKVQAYQSDKTVLINTCKKFIHSTASFIQDQLHSQLQKFSLKQINDCLTSEREKIFPSNEDIALTHENSRCKGGYDDFVFKQKNITLGLNNCIEKYIIFAVAWQLQLFEEGQEYNIFIDGTFRISPVNYTQLVTIMMCQRERFVPVAWILFSGKHQSNYELGFFAFKKLVRQYTGSYPKIKKVMTDFEQGLINGLKQAFPKAIFKCCYFHYIQALWNNANRLGLRKKQFVLQTKMLICFLKFMAYIKSLDLRLKYYENLKLYFEDIDDKYSDFLSYYYKTWIKKDFVDLFQRTDNINELNHRRINQRYQLKKPKMSKFLLFILQEEFHYRTQYFSVPDQAEVRYNLKKKIARRKLRQSTFKPSTLVSDEIQKLCEQIQDQKQNKKSLKKAIAKNNLFEQCLELQDDILKQMYGEKIEDDEIVTNEMFQEFLDDQILN